MQRDAALHVFHVQVRASPQEHDRCHLLIGFRAQVQGREPSFIACVGVKQASRCFPTAAETTV
jgi:hypothetical protein